MADTNKEWDAHQVNIPFNTRKDPTSAEYKAEGVSWKRQNVFEIEKRNRNIKYVIISIVTFIGFASYFAIIIF